MRKKMSVDFSDGQLKDLSIRLAKVEQNLVAIQVALARLETSNKMLGAVGGASAAGVVALLIKMLTA